MSPEVNLLHMSHTYTLSDPLSKQRSVTGKFRYNLNVEFDLLILMLIRFVNPFY